jgi:hypothetical protein
MVVLITRYSPSPIVISITGKPLLSQIYVWKIQEPIPNPDN